jgi:hypothetical protein
MRTLHRAIASRVAGRPNVETLLLVVVLGVAVPAALSIDVVGTGYGIKGDEATYVAMALSVAHDGDLAYERRDLVRFWSTYGRGPEGVFLKRGRDIDVALSREWPIVELSSRPDPDSSRLYFGKAYLYALVAAPFVRLAGLNGFLLLHVLLLTAVLAAGIRFLGAGSPPVAAWLFVPAFLGASVVPVYFVWLTPEVLNFSLVFLAYFLWLYKEIAQPGPGRVDRLLRSRWSDAAAACLLGLATFSKPLNAPLILPVVLLAFFRRRVLHGLAVGGLSALVALGSFGLNAVITGELNYQGGERKTFYGKFPFDAPDASFDTRGIAFATDRLDQEEVSGSTGLVERFADNVRYFFVGRHAGLVPYYFPAVVAIAAFLGARGRRRSWQWMILSVAALTVLLLLVLLPHTWAGGGGPPGNRYFLSVYPVLFFVTPRLRTIVPGLIAWLGGHLFLAQLLLNPFVTAARPWLHVERGLFRLLPVEMTMLNDLPVMLNQTRARRPVGDGQVLVYLLDGNAFPPEQAGVWIAGDRSAQLVIRSAVPLSALTIRVTSPVANRVTLDLDGRRQTLDLQPHQQATVTLRARGSYAERSRAYLLTVDTESGAVPRLLDPVSADPRFLGALLNFAPVYRAGAAEPTRADPSHASR